MPDSSLPTFTDIDIAAFPERLRVILAGNMQKITTLLEQNQLYTWDNLIHPLDDIADELERLWSPVAHLHAVINSPSLRDCYDACLPQLSAYDAALGHHYPLYKAIQSIDRSMLDAVQDKIIENTLRDFTLSGIALIDSDKSRFEAISARLSVLGTQFENNVLDATHAYEHHVTDIHMLSGLPEQTIESARMEACEQGLDGWVFTLAYPSYLAVMTHADNRGLREALYKAFVTRASDEGPTAGQFDNTSIMNEMLSLRQEEAQLLGFANFAQLSLATKMASSTEEVMHFLTDLTNRARAQAQVEFQNLQAFATAFYHEQGQTPCSIEPWDVAYLSEKQSQAQYAFSQEELRAYFPLPQVMTGLFEIIHLLYGMTVEEITGVDVWHPDVVCYRVLDEQQVVRGYVYVDLFARKHKRAGAWMDVLQSRRRHLNHDIQLPIATVTCNFAKASGQAVSTLLHDEVLTLFHEFGHCLHHVLTRVDYLSVSGIHGVEWDAVELPSQFFENWCWDNRALTLLTKHEKTNESLPESLLNQLIAAKNFQSAMAMMRQLEFSLFDFRIHQNNDAHPTDWIASTLAQVRAQTAVIPSVSYNRFQHSFSHIFGGGYAAGYYSYKWAEVLSSDAFARFEEEGVFNPATGRDFLHEILEVGGSRKAAESYFSFRGRMATIDALLKQNGIQEAS